MGRAPAYWTEETVKRIIENFVPLAVNGADQGWEDSTGEFYRNAGLKLDKYEASQSCVTADGRLLEAAFPLVDLESALEKWKRFPDAERAPGKVTVPDPGPSDTRKAAPDPPVGGLILKGFGRALMHDGGNGIRYVTGKDLCFDTEGRETLDDEFREGRTAAHEAQPDHLWLTESEWKSLIPVNPAKGDLVPLPANLVDRILRWHLNPLRFYGRYGPDALRAKEVRAGGLTLKVDQVGGDSVRLRMEGFASLGADPPAGAVEGKVASLETWGYEPQVQGILEYDPRKQIITRFDIVALGDHFGRLGNGRRAPSRIGLQPIGFAFELVKGDRPADRVPPGRISDPRSYFDLGRSEL